LLKSLKNRIQIALQLSSADWMDLVEAWMVLLRFKLALYWKNIDSFSVSKIPSAENNEITAELQDYSQHLHQLIHWASRLHILPMACLERSLTLRWMLVRRKISAQIRIGATSAQSEFAAHAWVEVNGLAIGESDNMISKFSSLKPTKNTVL